MLKIRRILACQEFSNSCHYRNDTACWYDDSGNREIECSNASLDLIKALEVPARIDETDVLIGATPNGGLVKCPDVLPAKAENNKRRPNRYLLSFQFFC